MARPRPLEPKYRFHKSSGQAYVVIDAKDVWLGEYGSAASRNKYHHVLSEWIARDRQGPPPLGRADAGATAGPDVTMVLAAFLRHAHNYYGQRGDSGGGARGANGSLPPGEAGAVELSHVRQAIPLVKRLYGDAPAAEFGPLELKAVRNAMIGARPAGAGWSRNYANAQTNRIRSIFKWAVANELVPSAVHQALAAVVGLRRGKTRGRGRASGASSVPATSTAPAAPSGSTARVPTRRPTTATAARSSSGPRPRPSSPPCSSSTPPPSCSPRSTPSGRGPSACGRRARRPCSPPKRSGRRAPTNRYDVAAYRTAIAGNAADDKVLQQFPPFVDRSMAAVFAGGPDVRDPADLVPPLTALAARARQLTEVLQSDWANRIDRHAPGRATVERNPVITPADQLVFNPLRWIVPDTTLTKPHTVKLSGIEFQQLVLMIDDMSRLHVPGIEELCRAAVEGNLSVLATMVTLEGRISEARDRERRRHAAARRLG
jgi:hypothetical protein